MNVLLENFDSQHNVVNMKDYTRVRTMQNEDNDKVSKSRQQSNHTQQGAGVFITGPHLNFANYSTI